MASLGSNVKTAMLRGLEALGRGASNMASNAHQKLNELNLETRRRELLNEIPVRALDLWQQGTELPEPLGDMLKELSSLDEQLTVLRAQRYARVESADSAEGENGAEDAPAESAEGEAAPADETDAPAVPTLEVPESTPEATDGAQEQPAEGNDGEPSDEQ